LCNVEYMQLCNYVYYASHVAANTILAASILWYAQYRKQLPPEFVLCANNSLAPRIVAAYVPVLRRKWLF